MNSIGQTIKRCEMLTKIKIAFIAALILGTASATLAGQDDWEDRGGFVMPCSLVGVNPVFHPRIFGNPAVAREYGFVKSRDSGLQVERTCVRGQYHN
jgi:hypothetical protein